MVIFLTMKAFMFLMTAIKIKKMLLILAFSISDALWDLVSLYNFKKVKSSHRGLFFAFLNGTNGTKLHKASHKFHLNISIAFSRLLFMSACNTFLITEERETVRFCCNGYVTKKQWLNSTAFYYYRNSLPIILLWIMLRQKSECEKLNAKFSC